MNKIQGLLVSASVALLVGCGDGDGSEGGVDSSGSSTNPVVIKKETSYQLSPNKFYDSYETGETANQFKFSAKKNALRDQLIRYTLVAEPSISITTFLNATIACFTVPFSSLIQVVSYTSSSMIHNTQIKLC